MRILLLTDLFPPWHEGGHELCCKINCDELRKRGHEVLVLTSNPSAGSVRRELGVLRVLHCLDVKAKSVLGKRWGHMLQGARARRNYYITRAAISSYAPDVIMAGKLMKVSYRVLKAARDLGIPTVHHVGHYDLLQLVRACQLEDNPFKRAYWRYVYGIRGLRDIDTSRVLVVSNAVKRRHQQIPLADKQITVIPPTGVPDTSIARYREGHRLAGRLRLLYVGRISREKGIDVAIEALRLLNGKGAGEFTLDVIGSGDAGYMDHLHKLAFASGVEQKLRFHQAKDHEAIFAEYRKYDALLVPSQWEEPFGMIVVEGMSQGIPVIASRVGGITDVIVDRENGLLVPPGAPDALAAAVIELANDTGLACRVGNNGMESVRSRFTRELIVGMLEEYLLSVCNVREKATQR